MNNLLAFLADFAESLAYSAIGFILGWLVGYEARRHEETKHMDGETRRRAKEGGGISRVGAFIIALSVATALQSAYFSWEQHRAGECFAQYNSDFGQVQTLRSGWADTDRQSLIEFFDSYSTDPPPSEEQARTAFFALQQKYATITKLREDTPLPDLPSCTQ